MSQAQIEAAATITLQGAGRRYGAAMALHPTDLVFVPGRCTALLGPSGCGKSTILRLIAGLIAPSEGRVLVGDVPVTAATLADVRARLGYVIQDGGLFPHLSAEANVLLMARERKLPEADNRARLAALCALTRFPPDALRRFPQELSGGQKQRVALMRALFLEPDVLLLDEPLGALDPLVRVRLQTDLKGIFAQLGTTVVLVTHDLAEAAYLGDTLVLMEEGRVVQTGTPAELAAHPATSFVREFLSAQRGLHDVKI